MAHACELEFSEENEAEHSTLKNTNDRTEPENCIYTKTFNSQVMMFEMETTEGGRTGVGGRLLTSEERKNNPSLLARRWRSKCFCVSASFTQM